MKKEPFVMIFLFIKIIVKVPDVPKAGGFNNIQKTYSYRFYFLHSSN